MLIILHCRLLGKIATGGVVAKRAVLNFAVNSSTGFASLLKGWEGNCGGRVREVRKKMPRLYLLRYTTFVY